MPHKKEPLESDSELNQQEIPLLSDIVQLDDDLREEDVAQRTLSIDSELALIEEDDFALQSLAEDGAALAKLEAEESYNYDDSEEAVSVADAAPIRLAVPQPDIVINAIRDELHKKLSKEMSELISPVLDQTIEQMAEVIRSELTQTLESRISTLIQQELDKQFSKQ